MREMFNLQLYIIYQPLILVIQFFNEGTCTFFSFTPTKCIDFITLKLFDLSSWCIESFYDKCRSKNQIIGSYRGYNLKTNDYNI